MIYKFGMTNADQYNGWTRENNTYYIKQSLRTTNNFTEGFTVPIDGVKNYTADTEEGTIEAFSKFEPGSKVYWYK